MCLNMPLCTNGHYAITPGCGAVKCLHTNCIQGNFTSFKWYATSANHKFIIWWKVRVLGPMAIKYNKIYLSKLMKRRFRNQKFIFFNELDRPPSMPPPRRHVLFTSPLPLLIESLIDSPFYLNPALPLQINVPQLHYLPLVNAGIPVDVAETLKRPFWSNHSTGGGPLQGRASWFWHSGMSSIVVNGKGELVEENDTCQLRQLFSREIIHVCIVYNFDLSTAGLATVDINVYKRAYHISRTFYHKCFSTSIKPDADYLI